MSRPGVVRLLVTVCLAWCAVPAAAQALSAPAQTTPAGGLKVLLTCPTCDLASLRSSLRFVEFVTDAASSDVDVTVTSAPVAPDVKTTIEIAGKGRYAGQTRRLSYAVAESLPVDQARTELARFLKLGLAEFASSTPAGQYLDLGFTPKTPTTGTSPIKKDQKDPWNYWVFRTSLSSYGYGEQEQSSSSYYVSGSANRTTDNWKMRIGGSRNLNKSSFTVDPTLTIKSKQTDWSVDGLAVKSLGPRWSFGLTSSVVGSTYSNSKLVGKVTPGIEFDVFPYSQSSKRSLTFQYTVGGAYYKYVEETIFSKFHENVAPHSAIVSLGFRQPWGQAGSSFTFAQQLNALDRTRLSFSGNFSIRLLKSLTLNASGSYSRIRDQFTLVKGGATEEEVLLRLQQLATGYRYSLGVGFGYAFGALSNATVNPRFGG